MSTHLPASVYKAQIAKHEVYLQKLMQKRGMLGWTRFLVFITTVIVGWKIIASIGIIGILVIVTGLALLIYLVIIDANNSQKINNTKTLIQINNEELLVLSHDYNRRYNGNEYKPADHDYANDLDLFGNDSLYQFVHRCFSEQGRNLLAKNLLHASDVITIRERQDAIKEIAPEIEWRQQFQSMSIQTTVRESTQQKTITWLNEEKLYFAAPAWKLFVLLYSLITVSSAVASILGFIPVGIFSFLYAVYLTTSLLLSSSTIKPYAHLSGIVKEVDTLYQLIEWIENRNFTSALLQRIQTQGKPAGEKAAMQIRELKNILDRFDLRLNIVGLLIFNSFLLWDVRQMIALNTWRKKNKPFVNKWFDAIAEMELVNSLATLHFNNPHWCFPEFSENYFKLDAKNLGHPLIKEQECVDNDFQMSGTGKIGLITGSNMAGKSTFLRSLGVNIVLAQLGATVCAQYFLISHVRLMSSMRVADNLAENTSTFYAELKKLKTIIETVNRREDVFILLDEILRGTNSLDRHAGSEALIAQLIKEKTVAVIATHDLELAGLKNQYSESIENYHFDVKVTGEELHFDYKLKDGVCTSMNASILMKKIGIQLH
ncbi:MAG: MutS family DNA mismatch repair protein [Flavisolibacter sp.]